MYKYEMIIDGDNYNALFESHDEGAMFLDDCARDGMATVLNRFYEVGVEDILNDHDFEYAYKIEMVAIMTLPNHADFDKWYEQEIELQKLGIIA